MKLLLIEDNATASAAISKGLREQGFLVTAAMDGEQGLQLALETDWDCLVLDVMLPGMDGFTLLTELRAAGVATPVIFLTARDSLPDRLRGLEAGGDYLVKPFAFSELVLRLGSPVTDAKGVVSGGAIIKYGVFLNTVLQFVIIAIAIFLVVQLMNKLIRKEEAAPAPPSPEVQVLTEIRDVLKARQ